MRNILILLACLTIQIAKCQNMANPIKHVAGDVGFLKGQEFVSVELVEENVLIDDIPQKEYIEKHKTERNQKKPGSGDTWEQNWVDNFQLYHKSLMKGLEEIFHLKDGSEYTLRIRIDRISPGFETGIGLMGKGSQLNGEVVVVRTSSPTKILARYTLDKVKGDQKFDLKTRLDFAYYRAGFWIAWRFDSEMKKSTHTEPVEVGTESYSAPPAKTAAISTVAGSTVAVAPVSAGSVPKTNATQPVTQPAVVVQPAAENKAKASGPIHAESGATIVSVKIGPQLWAAENLDVSTFNNGDPIPEAKSSNEWKKAAESKQPAWCYLSNDPTNGPKYGKLYNWYAVSDPRGLAPSGWHVPSDDDWRILIEITLGVDKKLTNVFKKDESGMMMKSKSDWDDEGNGTNGSGFDGFPGGSRRVTGEFIIVGREGNWWSATEYKSGAWNCSLFASRESISWKVSGKDNGYSVRCLKD